MTQKSFNITPSYSYVKIEKDGKFFVINKAPDNDIWFETKEELLTFDLSFSSIEFAEWQTYDVFYNLLKAIIGRYFLNGDNKEYSNLPKDFIDMENKVITWHSDSATDNVLQLQYIDDIIRIKLIKSPLNKGENKIRIRTNGSDYDRYHQEFTFFYNQLFILAHKLEEKAAIKKVESKQTSTERKLTLKKLFKRQSSK